MFELLEHLNNRQTIIKTSGMEPTKDIKATVLSRAQKRAKLQDDHWKCLKKHVDKLGDEYTNKATVALMIAQQIYIMHRLCLFDEPLSHVINAENRKLTLKYLDDTAKYYDLEPSKQAGIQTTLQVDRTLMLVTLLPETDTS
jgi:hypothetical protein